MPKRVLVTGAAGFIAYHLIEALLKNGYDVTGVDNFDPLYSRTLKEKNIGDLKQISEGFFDFIESDLKTENWGAGIKKPFEVIIHMAAKAGVRPSIENPSEYIANNIIATENVLRFARKAGCKKLIFSSSSSVYGNSNRVPFCEDDKADAPLCPYAYTKRCNELQIYTEHHIYGLNAVCLRLFTVYGPRQRPDLAMRKFITKILRDEPIDKLGNGSSARDYTYVSDVVTGIMKAIDYLQNNQKVYEIVNIGSHFPITLNEMIEVIGKTLQIQPKINQLAYDPSDAGFTCADISKSQKLLGYAPSVAFEDGVKQLVEWIKKEQLVV